MMKPQRLTLVAGAAPTAVTPTRGSSSLVIMNGTPGDITVYGGDDPGGAGDYGVVASNFSLPPVLGNFPTNAPVAYVKADVGGTVVLLWA